MYEKVSTGLNFVDREKEVEKFWKEQDIFKKVSSCGRAVRPICFMTGRRRQTESHTSATC